MEDQKENLSKHKDKQNPISVYLLICLYINSNLFCLRNKSNKTESKRQTKSQGKSKKIETDMDVDQSEDDTM